MNTKKPVGQYYIDDLMEMGLPEIHEALTNGQVSLDVFAEYVNMCIALGGAVADKNNKGN